MSNAFRDQLLKAGLADAKKVKKVLVHQVNEHNHRIQYTDEKGSHENENTFIYGYVGVRSFELRPNVQSSGRVGNETHKTAKHRE